MLALYERGDFRIEMNDEANFHLDVAIIKINYRYGFPKNSRIFQRKIFV